METDKKRNIICQLKDINKISMIYQLHLNLKY